MRLGLVLPTSWGDADSDIAVFTIPAGFPFLAGETFTTGNRNLQMATVGINYRFNWGATGPMAAAGY
jgi:hypothetical protein